MSSRHIRREKERLKAPAAEAGEGQEESEEEEEDIGSTKPFNPFDLLSDGDDDDEVCEGRLGPGGLRGGDHGVTCMRHAEP